MPNNYTQGIYDGDTSAKNYILGLINNFYPDCSRELEAAMREVKKYQDQLSEVLSMPSAEIVKANIEANLEAKQADDRYNAHREALADRYSDIRFEVENWHPGNELTELKVAALDHLDKSCEFDCGGGNYERQPVSDADWLDNKLSFLVNMIASYRKDIFRYEETMRKRALAFKKVEAL